MTEYLEANRSYWSGEYLSPNVESYIFRFHGIILRGNLGIRGEGQRLVDFGCGQGSAVNFFAMHGFAARGCDISPANLEAARIRYPHIADRFDLVPSAPSEVEYYCYPDEVAVLTAGQSLYYFSDQDLEACLDRLHASMRQGGILFATMIGERNVYFRQSEDYRDGLRRVTFKNQRIDASNHYVNFTRDEDHLKRKFARFRPLFIGCYDMALTSAEESGFHYTFCGIKD